MQGPLLSYHKTKFSTYSLVIAETAGGIEYSLSFPKNVTDSEIQEAWENANCWRAI